MYPLSVTLVGCQDSVQRNVLSMLINQQANLDGQYADVLRYREHFAPLAAAVWRSAVEEEPWAASAS